MRVFFGLILIIAIFSGVAVFGAASLHKSGAVQDKIEEIRLRQDALSTIDFYLTEGGLKAELYMQNGNYGDGESAMQIFAQALSFAGYAVAPSLNFSAPDKANPVQTGLEHLRSGMSEAISLYEGAMRNEVREHLRGLMKELKAMSSASLRTGNVDAILGSNSMLTIIPHLAWSAEMVANGHLNRNRDMEAEYEIKLFLEEMDYLALKTSSPREQAIMARMQKSFEALWHELERVILLRVEVSKTFDEIFGQIKALKAEIAILQKNYDQQRAELQSAIKDLEQPYSMTAAFGGLALLLLVSLLMRSASREGKERARRRSFPGKGADSAAKARLEQDAAGGVAVSPRRRP